jgi:hypothetical protein
LCPGASIGSGRAADLNSGPNDKQRSGGVEIPYAQLADEYALNTKARGDHGTESGRSSAIRTNSLGGKMRNKGKSSTRSPRARRSVGGNALGTLDFR